MSTAIAMPHPLLTAVEQPDPAPHAGRPDLVRLLLQTSRACL